MIAAICVATLKTVGEGLWDNYAHTDTHALCNERSVAVVDLSVGRGEKAAATVLLVHFLPPSFYNLFFFYLPVNVACAHIFLVLSHPLREFFFCSFF